MNACSFQEALKGLNEQHPNDSFEYSGGALSFRRVVKEHFGDSKDRTYGVYILYGNQRQEVLYIGKGGTLDTDGSFKDQGLIGRLRNVRKGDVCADKWFRDLASQHGPIIVDYIELDKTCSPGFVEALLLQAHLNTYDRLPPKNSSL